VIDSPSRRLIHVFQLAPRDNYPQPAGSLEQTEALSGAT
jgi:hypothetical protein